MSQAQMFFGYWKVTQGSYAKSMAAAIDTLII